MDYQKTIDNIQLDRMAGDLTDEQADAAIEQILRQQVECVICGHIWETKNPLEKCPICYPSETKKCRN